MDSARPAAPHLTRKVLGRGLLAFVVLAASLFVPAGTLRYWEAWVYLAVLFVPASFVLVDLRRRDPELLERRMRTKEKEAEQRWIIGVFSLLLLAAFVLPGLDHRLGWSSVPVALVVVADGLVLAGYLLFWRVLRENSFASRTVEVVPGQKVVSTGLYARVRHPMYVAVLLIYLPSPLALGSFWALIPAAFLIPFLVFRIRSEERVLLRELEGYREYTRTVRYRLIPGVW